jgi:hypothetical protein
MKVLNLKILMKKNISFSTAIILLTVCKKNISGNFIAIENTVLLNGMMLKMMLLNK